MHQAVESVPADYLSGPGAGTNVERAAPRITSLYASALGQVLVVRRLQLDLGVVPRWGRKCP